MQESWLSLATDLLHLLDSYLGAARYFPFLLLGVGLFFTLYLKFPQIRYFRQAIRIVRGDYSDKNAPGDATHFQALATAISGTVGTGNIGGVALALYLGGPAALFWMWMTAFFGMTTKFVEVSLSHKYRQTDPNGHIVGGPMYVMERRLKLKWLAVFFAVATVISSFGTGNLPQSNNIASGLNQTFGVPEWLSGAVLASLLALVIIGGIRRIVKVAEKIVPIMAVFYVVGALGVILTHLPQTIASLGLVFQDAFTGSAASGGFLGASFAYAFNRGVNRGLFSNEAGQGSAPIAHAAAKTKHSVSEGMVSLLEPFIDTIIICTLTGLVILSSGVWTEKHLNEFERFDMQVVAGEYDDQKADDREALYTYLNSPLDTAITAYTGELNVVNGKADLRGKAAPRAPGMPDAASSSYTILHNRSVAEEVRFFDGEQRYTGQINILDGNLQEPLRVVGRSLIHSVELTAKAFSRGIFGDYGAYIVAIGLLLFAFTTAVAWFYYGDRAMTYLFGLSAILPYKIVYVLGFFIAAIADTSLIWLISAISIALMTLPNLVTIFLLRGEMREAVADYWQAFNREYPEQDDKNSNNKNPEDKHHDEH